MVDYNYYHFCHDKSIACILQYIVVSDIACLLREQFHDCDANVDFHCHIYIYRYTVILIARLCWKSLVNLTCMLGPKFMISFDKWIMQLNFFQLPALPCERTQTRTKHVIYHYLRFQSLWFLRSLPLFSSQMHNKSQLKHAHISV